MEALVSRPRGTVLDAARTALERDDVKEWIVLGAKLLPPILPPSLGEQDHKWIVAPEAEIPCPNGDGGLRFDLEVAAVIFRPKKPKLKPAQAKECIFGYTLMSYWASGEDFAASLGPCIVTADDFDDKTEVVVRVNDKEWSRGTLADAETPFAEQIVKASKTDELLPGEVFGSGTLGKAKNGTPRPGAVVEIKTEVIGILRNRIGRQARRRAAS